MSSYLIVRLGSLGDVIHAVPAAAALRAKYEHARIDWMVDPRYVELLNLVSCVNRAIPVDPRNLLRGSEGAGFRNTFRDLRQVGYLAAIDMQGLVKSAVLARLAGAERTIGFPRLHLREPLARLLYTDTPDPGDGSHVIYKNLALLRAVNVQDRRLRFPITIPSTAAVDAVLRRFAADRYVLINPGAAWPNKRWPAVRFGTVAASMHKQWGLRSLVLWGPGEESLAQAVVEGSAGAAEVSPATTIADLVGIASGARLMISGDTGPLHIAGAVGTPIVALFGPTRPERNGPWGLYDITLSRVEQCSCHYERRCRKAQPCIDDIQVDEVLKAVERRLDVDGESGHRPSIVK